MNNHQFRTDINGLRAYAVILVVLFHFKVLGFSAGFLGVDIFFVISGYLMSKIIIEKLNENNFTFFDFYLSRALRIIPALFFLILFITILGWFIFIPEDFKNFSKDARYSLTFLSNNLYYRQAGDYFAANTHDKALLHTWSLSVEWQFYLVFPILLAIFHKLVKSQRLMGLFLILLFSISLLSSIIITPKDSIYAFFSLTTRAWELIAGGLVYYYFKNFEPTLLIKNSIFTLGSLLIVLSLTVFNTETVWPSFNALIPVIGTMCILVANQQHFILTSTKPIQWLGNCSYSIYLWHWPILFLLGYLLIEHNFINISLAIGLSILLGWLSYRYIESSRKIFTQFRMIYAYAVFIGIIAIFCMVYSYVEKDGIQHRVSNQYLSKIEKIQMPMISNGWCFYNIKDDHDLKVGDEGLKCYIGSNKEKGQRALLFGDSFAGHNIPFWDSLGKKVNLSIHTISTNWCYPSLNKDFTGNKLSTAYQQCLINRNFLAKNIEQYDILIFAGRWSDIVGQNQQKGFAELLKFAEQHHKKVIVMSEPYAFDQNISSLFKRALWLNLDFNLNQYMNNPKATQQIYATKQINEIVALHSNTLLLTRNDLFSPDQMATTNTPYSLDGRHMSIVGSLASEKYFEQQPKFSVLEKFISEKY